MQWPRSIHFTRISYYYYYFSLGVDPIKIGRGCGSVGGAQKARVRGKLFYRVLSRYDYAYAFPARPRNFPGAHTIIVVVCALSSRAKTNNNTRRVDVFFSPGKRVGLESSWTFFASFGFVLGNLLFHWTIFTKTLKYILDKCEKKNRRRHKLDSNIPILYCVLYYSCGRHWQRKYETTQVQTRPSKPTPVILDVLETGLRQKERGTRVPRSLGGRTSFDSPRHKIIRVKKSC